MLSYLLDVVTTEQWNKSRQDITSLFIVSTWNVFVGFVKWLASCFRSNLVRKDKELASAALHVSKKRSEPFWLCLYIMLGNLDTVD